MDRNPVSARVEYEVEAALNSLPIDLPPFYDSALNDLRQEVKDNPGVVDVDELIEEMENIEVKDALTEAFELSSSRSPGRGGVDDEMKCWAREHVIEETPRSVQGMNYALNVFSNEIRCIFEDGPDEIGLAIGRIENVWADLGYMAARSGVDVHSLILALPEAYVGAPNAKRSATKEMIQEVLFNRAGNGLRFWVPGESQAEVEARLAEQSDGDH